MLRLIRVELIKQLRRPRTWVVLGFVILVPIIITIALKANPPSITDGGGGGDGGSRGGGVRFFYLASQSGLLVPIATLRVMSEFFLVVIFCLFAGDSIASEAGWGNLRFLLTRPIGRGRLIAAKLIVAAFYSALATLLIVVSGLIAGGIAFGYESISIPLLGISMSVGSILGNIALAGMLAAWGITGIAVFAFMLSTMMDNSAGAIMGAVGAVRRAVDPRRHRLDRPHSLRLPDVLQRRVGRPLPWGRLRRRHGAQRRGADPVRDRLRRYRALVVPPQGRHELVTAPRARSSSGCGEHGRHVGAFDHTAEPVARERVHRVEGVRASVGIQREPG